jgi:hypothetical protein
MQLTTFPATLRAATPEREPGEELIDPWAAQATGRRSDLARLPRRHHLDSLAGRSPVGVPDFRALLQTGTGTAHTTAISAAASTVVIFSLVGKVMAASDEPGI